MVQRADTVIDGRLADDAPMPGDVFFFRQDRGSGSINLEEVDVVPIDMGGNNIRAVVPDGAVDDLQPLATRRIAGDERVHDVKLIVGADREAIGVRPVGAARRSLNPACLLAHVDDVDDVAGDALIVVANTEEHTAGLVTGKGV